MALSNSDIEVIKIGLRQLGIDGLKRLITWKGKILLTGEIYRSDLRCG